MIVRRVRINHKITALAFLICAGLFFLSYPVHAQEVTPGDQAEVETVILDNPIAKIPDDASGTDETTEENISSQTVEKGGGLDIDTAHLPRDLSPVGMFIGADWVVKSVIIGLMMASILTWTVLIAKSLELSKIKGKQQGSLMALKAARTLADAAADDNIVGIGRDLVAAGEAELRLSADAADKEGIKERLAASLSRLEAAFARQMTVGTGLLATIGAVGPFVGLFGTVWGIMNSFIGIAEAQTTNLAVVAPGIAEALLATALGLVAAIPAVVIYNHFTRKIANTKAKVADMTVVIMCLISRDLDRGVSFSIVKVVE